jgi:hypothetical protein
MRFLCEAGFVRGGSTSFNVNGANHQFNEYKHDVHLHIV